MNPAIKTAINIVGSQKKLGAACESFTAGPSIR